MDDLRPTDPARIGGHRLLGRLGAGGMGVVYLGRTDAGALAAIKVILPEYAGDEDFRTRFRREAEAARRVDSPWAVPVTGADTEAERPWLATEFVPGPTLFDVVARRGPLPVRSVTVLGRLLARALAAVHAAGLVHRDVKPGNVLLTAGGPRLIDFGIARAADATALTATGLVVGTPGFLPPEQASGNTAGPAGDVFSLGCLLAYAATGRPPFGSGAVDAVLYRTVHDAPDLDGIDDAPLRALLDRCLAKDPGERPAAAGLDTLIAEDVPAGATADWLPEDVVRIIADRSAALLALPGIDATVTEEPGPPEPAPGRRRFLLLAAGGAVALGAGAFAAVRLTRDEPADGGDGAPGGRRWIIGVHADLTGPLSAAGRAQERGVRLAVDRFNSLDDQPFRLAVKVLDDQGDAGRSARVAEEFAHDPEVIAVIGPTGDEAAGAALSAYDEAVLPVLTVSALQIAFPKRANGSFFQAAPSYASLAVPIVNRLLLRPDVERLGILVDRSGGQAAYQAGYATNLLTPDLTTGTTHPRVVPAGTRVFDPVVTDLLSNRSDALFYAGDAAGASQVARILADLSFAGPLMAQHTVMGPEFLEQAGAAADGWEFVAPFTDASAPAAATFAAAHRKRFGVAPAAWSAEAYDVAGLVARELATLAVAAAKGASASASPSGDGRSTRPTRSGLTAAIAAARYEGVSRTYAFDEKRQQLVGQDAHLYRVEEGRHRYLGPAPKPKS
ncbi:MULTISPECIES: bifunctional serine/threonine-protein kinase/ABC transporter substrate-binding protein [Streptomyces]|uniref:bifunctional serine/threonine-protein kinase/ABC transporter substrate-binding protein n=1 Tax=Streptomyces TaxID=1883 RepID=UPI0004C52AB8|nr:MULTISPECIES: bifunctional serine/threonine-protein kinase/ABC transporter substrate-binding protein [Streptomyces]RPK89813.1 Serine/threonine-protein kinase AfsK [Streptomyces sp. ADI98-10]